METLRARGLRIGELEPGAANSIADVAGVKVGHVTIVRDDPCARTRRHGDRPAAPPCGGGDGGAQRGGRADRLAPDREWGVLETPVYLTATMAVGRVYDGAVAAAIAADPSVGVDDVVIPVVGECDDSWLSDPRPVHVSAADVSRRWSAAGPVEQGAVGAGTGMVCFDFKGGIGSSSRVVASGAVVGALVLANFGSARDLRIDGVPVGRELAAPGTPPAGSCIVVLATDAALDSAGLERLARRAGLGLARCGSVAAPRERRDLPAPSPPPRRPPPRSTISSPPPSTRPRRPSLTRCGRLRRPRGARPHRRSAPAEPVLEMLARAGRLG